MSTHAFGTIAARKSVYLYQPRKASLNWITFVTVQFRPVTKYVFILGLEIAANDDNNADQGNREKNDVMTPIIIFIILLICSIGIACIIFWVVKRRKQKLQETVSTAILEYKMVIWLCLFSTFYSQSRDSQK